MKNRNLIIVNDYINQKINYLTILKDYSSPTKKVVLVRCECGVEKTVVLRQIITNRTKSCGCKKRELLRIKKLSQEVRCLNEIYKDYQQRSIKKNLV